MSKLNELAAVQQTAILESVTAVIVASIEAKLSGINLIAVNEKGIGSVLGEQILNAAEKVASGMR